MSQGLELRWGWQPALSSWVSVGMSALHAFWLEKENFIVSVLIGTWVPEGDRGRVEGMWVMEAVPVSPQD